MWRQYPLLGIGYILLKRDAAPDDGSAETDAPKPTAPKELDWNDIDQVDLIGLEVINREGVLLGQVHDLLQTGPQTVLVIRAEQDGASIERLIPFVSVYVDSVSVADRRIVVDWQPDD